MESGRDRMETGGFRSQSAIRRVGSANDEREFAERRIGDPVLLDDRIERAAIAAMSQFNVRNVKRNRRFALGRFCYAIARHENELRLGIDESLDEPWTCNAIHLRVLACDEFHRMPLAPGTFNSRLEDAAGLAVLLAGSAMTSSVRF